MGVFALGAALAGGADFVEPGLHVADGELIQALGAQGGREVEPGQGFVGGTRQGREVGRHDFL